MGRKWAKLFRRQVIRAPLFQGHPLPLYLRWLGLSVLYRWGAGSHEIILFRSPFTEALPALHRPQIDARRMLNWRTKRSQSDSRNSMGILFSAPISYKKKPFPLLFSVKQVHLFSTFSQWRLVRITAFHSKTQDLISFFYKREENRGKNSFLLSFARHRYF